MQRRRRIVELADRRTWPPDFRDLVSKVLDEDRPVEQRAGWIEDPPFVEALDGALLRTYHCTRLTASELAWVREEGLHPLSAELAERKIDQAVADGHLTEEEGQLYRANHMGRHRNRAGNVCLVGDRSDLASPFQVGWLLALWGGEAINHSFSTRSAESKRLGRVGTPTVVVALLDPATEVSFAHPGIGLSAVRRLAAARRIAADEPGTSVGTEVTLGPERIEAIHQPGTTFWDRYVRQEDT